MWPHITDKRGTNSFFLLCLQGKEKNNRSKEKKRILDDVERISIYKKERIFCRNDSQSLCKFSHHTRPSDIHKSDAAAAGGFFLFLSCKPVSCSPATTYLSHPPPPSSQRISRRVSEKDPVCVVQAWMVLGGMSIADKKSTHHHHHRGRS